ncbi:hypothetical protein [Pseudochryseolinea flava]|uniref:Uncharacterized protein n=1 Tax=Pseudochryseolinea flava TaxID=2059302 RepID=A0A364XYF5_9BACT|nr:hypothetical protein [Pseudochryseolinea flava]RAV99025.1 hypothetical protein DQQ10_20740 [Pseudochryseolinea flava]
MNIEPAIANRIVKNVLVSLLIYALPIVLMFLSFYLSGERPWKKNSNSAVNSQNEKTIQP